MKLGRWIFILVAAVALMAGPPQDKKGGGKQNPKTPAAASAGVLDINQASEKELKELPGIGDAYAAKIVAGRPYRRKDQLVQKKIVPEATYEKIKDRIVAKQPGKQ